MGDASDGWTNKLAHGACHKKAAPRGGHFRDDGQRRLININILIAKNAKLGRIAPRIGGKP